MPGNSGALSVEVEFCDLLTVVLEKVCNFVERLYLFEVRFVKSGFLPVKHDKAAMLGVSSNFVESLYY